MVVSRRSGPRQAVSSASLRRRGGRVARRPGRAAVRRHHRRRAGATARRERLQRRPAHPPARARRGGTRVPRVARARHPRARGPSRRLAARGGVRRPRRRGANATGARRAPAASSLLRRRRGSARADFPGAEEGTASSPAGRAHQALPDPSPPWGRAAPAPAGASAGPRGDARRRDELERVRPRLLIADGHHRYETALRFHEEEESEETAYVLAALVSREDLGVVVFPTHRLVRGSVPDLDGRFDVTPVVGTAREAAGRLDDLPRDRPAFVVLRRDGALLAEAEHRA